jgi:iron complex transport system substrate-binding protein
MVARFAILLLLAVGAFSQPRRIVSTAPSITEMLYALELGDRVVGVTTFCHYPPEAASKPKIGNYLRPNVEVIVALRPDLIIVEKSMIQQTLWLPRLKLNVLEVDDTTVEGIYESIRAIGRATGAAPKAEAVCVGMKSEVESVRRRAANLPPVRILFVVGRTPGRIEDLIAAGGSSYLNEILTIAGGRNVLGDAAMGYAKVSLEEVLSRDPDVIIDMGEMAQTVGVTEEQKRAVVRLWGRYPNLKAVRTKRVFAVASDIFVVPGPRVTDAARQLAGLLHPGLAP